jgi:serine/threonine-protein kinase
LIGQVLGSQYRIVEVLGAGGMATVYRARQTSVDRDVAIKVIRAEIANQSDFQQRFEREARTIAAFSHPHIIKLFDYGQHDQFSYLVMELMTGGNLSQLIRDKNGLTPTQTGRLLRQISGALDYAHGQGVVHRDLKTPNILLDGMGNAILTDFGIAKLLQGGNTNLTQTGTSVGTPSYMSPEQWRGEELDNTSDIYSLGIILFEMLTGRLPFTSDTPYGMMHSHLFKEPPVLTEVNFKLPPSVDPVVRRALAKDRTARYQTALDLCDAYDLAIQQPSAPAPAQPPTPPPYDDATEVFDSRAAVSISGAPPAPPPPPRSVPSIRSPMPSPETAAPAPAARAGGGRNLLPLAIIPVLLLVGAAVFFLLPRGGGDVTPTPTSPLAVITDEAVASLVPTATPSEQAVAQVPSSTPTLASSATPLPASATTAPTAVPPSQTPSEVAQIPTVPASPTVIGIVQVATVAPTATPTHTLPPTHTATHTPVPPTPTATATHTATHTASATFTATHTATNSATPTPTATHTATHTATATATSTATNTATPTFTATPTVTQTPTATPTATATATPTLTFVEQIPYHMIVNRFSTESSDIYIVNMRDEVQQFVATGGKPSISPDGQTILFDSDFTGDPEIYAVGRDGMNPRNLTNAPNSMEFYGVFSPDGSSIVFHSNRSGNFDLFLMNPDGSNVRQLTRNPANDQWPAWSPDGTKIAFASIRTGNFEIYIYDLATDQVTQVTNNPAADLWATWSPDGTQIAFQSNRDGNQEIYAINIDGTGERRLTNNAAEDQWPSWSPAPYILFASNRDGNIEAYVLDPTTLEEYRITNSLFEDRFPEWVPITGN